MRNRTPEPVCNPLQPLQSKVANQEAKYDEVTVEEVIDNQPMRKAA
jgi:hypothetical protein